MGAVRSSLKIGAQLAAVTLGIEALAVIPGRVALGAAQGQYGRSPAEFAVAGTFRDLSDLALPVGGLVALVLALALTLRPQRPFRIFAGALGVFSVLLWLCSSSAAEFKLQRGVDMTWFDLEI